MIKDYKYAGELIFFFHKIDLLGDEVEREEKILEIKFEIKRNYGITTYFTSIHPNLIYSLYGAFYSILSIFSEETKEIKKVLERDINDLSKTIYLITNQTNSIVAQSMTHDFNFKYINHIHNLIVQLNQTLEEMKGDDTVEHLILRTKQDFNVIMKNLELSEFLLKNIICISETLIPDKLIWLAGEKTGLIKDIYLG